MPVLGPEAVRAKAEEALSTGVFDSVKSGLGAWAILVGIAIAVLGFLHTISMLNGPTAIGCLVMLGASAPGLVLVFEMARLHRCRRALETLMADERFYDQLLQDVRRERDDIKALRERENAAYDARESLLKAQFVGLLTAQQTDGSSEE
jgi:hypothetical protein